jgi:hypothetical protein
MKPGPVMPAREFLNDDDIVQPIRAGTSVGLGHVAAEQAHLAGLAPDGPRHDLVGLPFGMSGNQFRFNKTADVVAKLFVLRREELA